MDKKKVISLPIASYRRIWRKDIFKTRQLYLTKCWGETKASIFVDGQKLLSQNKLLAPHKFHALLNEVSIYILVAFFSVDSKTGNFNMLMKLHDKKKNEKKQTLNFLKIENVKIMHKVISGLQLAIQAVMKIKKK